MHKVLPLCGRKPVIFQKLFKKRPKKANILPILAGNTVEISVPEIFDKKIFFGSKKNLFFFRAQLNQNSLLWLRSKSSRFLEKPSHFGRVLNEKTDFRHFRPKWPKL